MIVKFGIALALACFFAGGLALCRVDPRITVAVFVSVLLAGVFVLAVTSAAQEELPKPKGGGE